MLPSPSGSQPSRTSLPFRALSFAPVGSPDLLSWDLPRVRLPCSTSLQSRIFALGPPPLHRPAPRRPLPRPVLPPAASGSEKPLRTSRADLVVSHHLAGFLRRSPRLQGCRPILRWSGSRGLVASRCRSWGSSYFSSMRRVISYGAPRCQVSTIYSHDVDGFPTTLLPLEGCSPLAAAPCHHGRCPPGVPLAPRVVCLGGTVASSSVSNADRLRRRLQGFAPRKSPYHRSRYSRGRWPFLPGLFSSSRSFDHRAASRVLADGHPLCGRLHPTKAQSVWPLSRSSKSPARGVVSLSAAPFCSSSSPSRRSSRRGRQPVHGRCRAVPEGTAENNGHLAVSFARCPPPREQTFASKPRLVRVGETSSSSAGRRAGQNPSPIFTAIEVGGCPSVPFVPMKRPARAGVEESIQSGSCAASFRSTGFASR